MPLPVRKDGLPAPLDLRNFLLSEPLPSAPLLTSFLEPTTGVISSSELSASLKRGRGLPLLV